MADVFRELAADLPYPLGLQLVTDEEVGGYDGTAHQIERGVSGRTSWSSASRAACGW